MIFRKFSSRPPGIALAQSQPIIRGAPLQSALNTTFLAVEIGCGVGWHPIQYVKDHPTRTMIAIERTTSKFSSFSRRLERHADLHPRLCAVHADAFQFLDENLCDRSIDEVWIMYPNPEPKKSSRRWFHSPFTGRLAELMKIDGVIHFATNIESYAIDCELLAEKFGFRIESFERIDRLQQPSWQPRSHFEKKYFERGEIIFVLRFRLNLRKEMPQ